MKKLKKYFQNNSYSKFQIAGVILIIASVIANFFNFLYNAYLGRVIGLEEFGVISLIGSFLSLSQIPLSAFSRTITHRSAYLFGKYESPISSFWLKMRRKSLKPSIVLTAIWLLITPFLVTFFHTESFLPFLLLTPIWFIGITAAVDSGYLNGNLKFLSVAVMTVAEVVSKFVITLILVETNNIAWIYSAIPLSAIISFLIGWIAAYSLKSKRINLIAPRFFEFPKLFYASSILTKVTAVAFLSADVLLAKHYLPAKEAGLYAMLSLAGKMVYFLGGLFTQFAIPLISRNEGAGINSDKTFKILLVLTSFSVAVGFVGLGLFGFLTVPILLGEKSLAILPFLPFYTFAMGCLPIASVIVSYHQSKEKHVFAIASFIFSILTIFGIVLFHKNIFEINTVITIGGVLYLLGILLLHRFAGFANAVLDNFLTIFRLFSDKGIQGENSRANVLIFNWRDLKHTWAGGAEVYIQELAKRLVLKGYGVTIFCGNDGQSPKNQTVDGINVVRRGGFYTVYFWAFLYYVLKFRNKFDVIIDCENGIPFFTPLFAREKTFLLIHHIHQEVFMTDLRFPLAQIGRYLEGVLMPLVYKNTKVITVSESSKQAIMELGFGKKSEVSIVSPGVDLEKFQINLSKTNAPSLLYLGRLKPYKSVDRLIKIMKKVRRQVPGATLTIAGEGESRGYLEELTQKLCLSDAIKFLGAVNEKTKIELFAKSWILVQPSKIEGWGITVIEANAAGTTVIASDVPGLRDSVQNPHTGLLVTWDNEEKWIDAITKVLKDKEFRGFLETNSKNWVKEFTWEKSSNKLMRLLKD